MLPFDVLVNRVSLLSMQIRCKLVYVCGKVKLYTSTGLVTEREYMSKGYAWVEFCHRHVAASDLSFVISLPDCQRQKRKRAVKVKYPSVLLFCVWNLCRDKRKTEKDTP